MNKIFKNRKGVTLVTVVIVVTVLVLLSSLLINIVLNNLVLTKRHKNIDFAYYAGESATENWMSIIGSEIKNNTGIYSDYPDDISVTDPDSRKSYAEHIVNKLKGTSILKDLWIDISNKKDSLVATAASDTSAHVKFLDIEVADTKWDSTMGNNIEVYIGVKAKSSFSLPDTPYNAGNKEVYAVKPFEVSCPSRNYLESAVWAVGDFYVNGNKNGKTAVVKGDVFTFGSYAKDTNSMAQELFGGIYALNGGLLNIYGNAYSRSFIRTGPYATEDDNSDIKIYKDAIAQCIQAFGDDDKIVGLRNAYTFDDVEVNGENSIIAINGSYFGLERGGSTSNHDQSSAVVNSAMIHSLARRLSIDTTDDCFKSRITINGDVIIGGSTMKVLLDPADPSKVIEVLGPIENASLAYNKDEDIPQYKIWSRWGEDPLPIEDYHETLRDLVEDGKILGNLNQFQVHNFVSPYNPANISDWINNISADSYTNNPVLVSGWASYEMIANDKVYKKGNIDTVETYTTDYFVKSTLDGYEEKLNHYRLDNIFGKVTIVDDEEIVENDKIKYSKEYWDNVEKNVPIAGGVPLTIEEFLFGYDSPSGEHVAGKLEEIKNDLKGKVHRYVTREYGPSEWSVGNLEEFHKTLEKLKQEADMIDPDSDAEGHVLYIENGTEYQTDPDPDLVDLKDLYKDKLGIDDIYANCSVRDYETADYYVLANADPDLHLSVSGEFNGIIVTAGKVYLEENASVYGSIIAAGTGDYVGDTFYPRAEAVTSTEKDNLNNGEFAAVIINIEDDDGDGDINPPYVDFYLGLAGDKDVYTESDLMNVINKSDYSEPSDTDVNDDLVYLNRAARVNLLDKFLNDYSINLYDIF